MGLGMTGLQRDGPAKCLDPGAEITTGPQRLPLAKPQRYRILHRLGIQRSRWLRDKEPLVLRIDEGGKGESHHHRGTKNTDPG